jgi:hypothetical protein
MSFVKGMVLGMVAGMAIGVTKSDCIIYMIRKGKRQMKRFRRKYSM